MTAKPPNEAKLYEAALNHLARYAATEASLARVLARKVDRWVRLQGDDEDSAAAAKGAKACIPLVLARLKAANLLNDGDFAESRARRLTREGKSRRGALAHLAAKGVGAEAAQAAVADDPARELAAACAFLRRRRAGPFGDAPERQVLGAMARAGFSQSTARAALRIDRDEAEALIKGLEA
jgi:regulatory protein